MKIFYLILSSFCFVPAFSQNSKINQKEAFYLSGNVAGRDTGRLILRYYDSNEKWVQDTTYLDKGKFEFKGQINQPTHTVMKGYPKVINFNEANYVGFFLEAGRQTVSHRPTTSCPQI